MAKRIFWGLVMGAAVIAALFLGFIPRLAIITVIMFIANSEMLGALKAMQFSPVVWPSYFYCLMLAPVYYFFEAQMVMLMSVIITIAVFCQRVFSKDMQTRDVFSSLIPILYPLAPFQFLLSAVLLPDPLWYSVIITGVAAACLSDTFALFTGMAIGKHKLAPKISPKKTIEGAIGGFAGALLAGVAIYFLQWVWGASYDLWIHLIACSLGSVAGQMGDLSASLIKREADIKDFGKLIPGHGGILDRLDSILFAMPLVYAVMVFFCQ